jgi:hypothetical protein
MVVGVSSAVLAAMAGQPLHNASMQLLMTAELAAAVNRDSPQSCVPVHAYYCLMVLQEWFAFTRKAADSTLEEVYKLEQRSC